MTPSAIKTMGYIISTWSVLLLAAVGWKGASEHPPLMACLIGGVATSILGMGLRWLSYRREKAEPTGGLAMETKPPPRAPIAAQSRSRAS